jgi:hypothetical protein
LSIVAHNFFFQKTALPLYQILAIGYAIFRYCRGLVDGQSIVRVIKDQGIKLCDNVHMNVIDVVLRHYLTKEEEEVGKK